jgi:hypothetical protein
MILISVTLGVPSGIVDSFGVPVCEVSPISINGRGSLFFGFNGDDGNSFVRSDVDGRDDGRWRFAILPGVKPPFGRFVAPSLDSRFLFRAGASRNISNSKSATLTIMDHLQSQLLVAATKDQ